MFELIIWTAVGLSLTFTVRLQHVHEEIIKHEDETAKSLYKLLLSIGGIALIPLLIAIRCLGVWALTKAFPLWVEFIKSVV